GRGGKEADDPGGLALGDGSAGTAAEHLTRAADDLGRGDEIAVEAAYDVGDLLLRSGLHQQMDSERRRSAGRARARDGTAEKFAGVGGPVALSRDLEAGGFEGASVLGRRREEAGLGGF